VPPDDHERELADNQKLWDAWTPIHTSGSFYNVDKFRGDRRDIRIRQWEREEVGDVAGKTLLHVQCHFGLDTLSWARLGATVTGIDFSEAAVEFAGKLASETGLANVSRFVVSGVYDLPERLAGETFDVVYTSRGAIGWLPDIDRWGEIVASFVKPGGVFYIHDAHPMLEVVDDKQILPNDLHLAYEYWSGDVITDPVQGSYADPDANVGADSQHGWNHSMGEIVTSLARGGLRIEFLHEKRTVAWPVGWLVKVANGQYGFPPDQVGTMPLMFSLRARRDG
jgi:SAM-dependent methyltransferase